MLGQNLQSVVSNGDRVDSEDLAAMLCREQRDAWESGKWIPSEAYLRRYAGLRSDADAVLDLIYNEIVLRTGAGESPRLDEFTRRFPEFADELPRLFEVHEAIESYAPPECRQAADRTTQSGGRVADPARTLRPRGQQSDASGGPGERIGGYHILEEVGRGGMGIVYRARQPGTNRVVALKVILTGRFAVPQEIVRFRAEAEAAARLDHPAIVPVFEVGREGDIHYFSMGYVEGESLAAVLSRGPLPSRAAAELLRNLSEAVDYAHTRGIIHRDLKPHNILIDAAGHVRITDFGLALQYDQHRPLTTTGRVLGTPHYMAPEQAEGRQGEVGPAADIYGLGAVLYHVLTGQPPFDAPTAVGVLTQVVQQDPVAPRSHIRAIDEDLDTICLKCLEKDPRRRYLSAAELAEDLRRYLAAEPIAARRITPAGRLWRWCRRNPLPAALTAAVMLLLMATSIGASMAAWRLRLAADVQSKALREASQARTSALDAERATLNALDEKRRLLVREYVEKGMQLADAEGDPLGSLVWFAEAMKLDLGRPDRERTQRMRLAAVLARAPALVQLWTHADHVYYAEFSPDGGRVVTASRDGTARIWNAATGDPLTPPLRHRSTIVKAILSPDGNQVATASTDRTVRLWDGQTGEPGSPPLAHEGYLTDVRFSPDGRLLAAVTGNGWAYVWEAATGSLGSGARLHSDKVQSISFSPDGQLVVTAAMDKTARVWDVRTTEQVLPELRHIRGVASARFSPDGQRIVTASYDYTARLWDAATGRPLGEPMRHANPVICASFSPDGGRVVTASYDRTARLWDAHTGRPITTPLPHDGSLREAVFSRDGRSVVTATFNHTARVWDSLSGRPVSPPLRHAGKVNSASLSPDGRYVLTASDDQTARVWRLPSHSGPQFELPHGALVYRSSFSPDGRFAATAGGDGTARVWDVATGAAICLVRHDDHVEHAVFSPAGDRLLTASHDGAACLWDVWTGERLAPPLTHGDRILHVAFSPDGDRIVTTSQDRTARVWDANSGEPLGPPLTHPGSVPHASFHPDGHLVATATADDPRALVAQIWQPATGELIHELKHKGWVSRASFSPDGLRLLTVSGERVSIWDTVTAQQINEPVEHSGLLGAFFSPDGRLIVTTSRDQTARLWDAATGQPTAPPLRHAHLVGHAAFSPDGRWLITASRDNTARIWDAATGEPLTPALVHDGWVLHASFSPAGRTVITSSADGKARLWPIAYDDRPLDELMRGVRLLGGRELDPTGGLIPLSPDALRELWRMPSSSRSPAGES